MTVLAMVAVLAALLVGVSRSAPAEAAYAGDFNPAYIISDERFFDNGSMTEAQIQAFLSAQVPRCYSTDPTLPCLPSLITSTSNRAPAANGCAGYASEAWESSAHILWKIAQACRINAQVLIVMLQKEQSLVTATKPTLRQYQAAMGANCPDTAPCAPTTLGFFNQVYTAAWQMRQYTYVPNSWRHRIGPTSVYYSPTASCGSSIVNIRNQATANLYNYTPYQPNAAALANLYGTGDSCSTYGNRNFWRFFSDWFGSPIASGTTQIDGVYNAMGGATGVLGNPTSDYIAISTISGAGTGRAYDGGSVYWSPRTGAAAVIEPFRAFYFGYGGATGRLGWPNSQSAAIPGRPGGAGQSFLYGSVYKSDTTGIHSVIGVLRDLYFGFGGATGSLGWPTSESRTVTTNGSGGTTSGLVQDFEAGQALSATRTGTFAVPGAILATYTAQGGPASDLGWPISPANTYPVNGGGSGQVFEGGSIYSSAAGAYVVSGAFRDAYFSVGGAAGWIGWPTTASFCISADQCWQHFQNASILKEPAGARIALAAIEEAHAAAGGDAGSQGRRTSGLIRIAENGGGLGQVYANASIYFSRTTGAFGVGGPIRDFYWANGGAAGKLGFPVSAETCTAGACQQSFSGGTVFWNAQDGAFVSSPAIAALYTASGGSRGVLGAPVSWTIPIPENGGGIGQAFKGGSVYSSAAGTFAVTEPIRAGYFGLNGAAGTLGWPTAAGVCDATSCRQSFTGGTLTWRQGVGYTVG
ncbi:LGFP repeat-containing protein [Microbacterium sp. B2969]|uniref:LGFP repeat-containing protein n=1 Tax=Microbacterium alkaliflavum TaxID=3248839 RepID=A0ABW7Q7A0_9MICO